MSFAWIPFLPDAWEPMYVVSGALVAMLVIGVMLGHWWDFCAQRRRRTTDAQIVEDGHTHRFIVGESVNRIAWGRCFCGKERVYEEMLT